MPLRIYLPPPPEGLFEDPDAVLAAAKDGIETWTDTAGPGVPSFAFVGTAGESDFPIAWAGSQPSVAIAHCAYAAYPLQRRFDVAQIVVTGRFANGTVAPIGLVRDVVLHEVGHALGIAGHSPNPEDLMYGFVDVDTPDLFGMRALTARDRATIRKLYEKPIGARIRAPRRAY